MLWRTGSCRARCAPPHAAAAPPHSRARRSALHDRRTGRRLAAQVELTNYTKERRPFRHVVTLEPITNTSGFTVFYRARSTALRLLDESESEAADDSVRVSLEACHLRAAASVAD